MKARTVNRAVTNAHAARIRQSGIVIWSRRPGVKKLALSMGVAERERSTKIGAVNSRPMFFAPSYPAQNTPRCLNRRPWSRYLVFRTLLKDTLRKRDRSLACVGLLIGFYDPGSCSTGGFPSRRVLRATGARSIINEALLRFSSTGFMSSLLHISIRSTLTSWELRCARNT